VQIKRQLDTGVYEFLVPFFGTVSDSLNTATVTLWSS
jgi:2-keto-3-deoxy-L-rhamnonate aldolase RhmA